MITIIFSLIELSENGKIDWTNGKVIAKGYGVFDPNAKNVQLEIIKATRVATVVAQRNLLETIKGVHITSQTIVEDYMLKNDLIISEVKGIVKGAKMIGEPKVDKEKGIVEVELVIDMFGDSGFIKPILPYIINKNKASADIKKEEINYSVAVIDASGKGAKPSVLPKFYDENGNLIFDASEIIDPNDPKALKVIKFVDNLNELLSDPELSKSPLVIKIKSVLNQRDFVVGKEEAEKIKWLKSLWKIGKKVVFSLF
jgi:hypothetical protein